MTRIAARPPRELKSPVIAMKPWCYGKCHFDDCTIDCGSHRHPRRRWNDVSGARNDVHHLPVTAREVFDVSGAGDTVVATLGLAIAAGASFIEAAELANVAAGALSSVNSAQPRCGPTNWWRRCSTNI